MEPKLKVEYVATETLAPYAHNAKEHPEWHVDQIANSIKQFGFSDPIGVWTNEQGVTEIVEGHGRVLAAKKLGIEKLPIIRLDHLDDEGRRAYTHVHNQTAMTTGFDWDVLDAEMASLPEFDWDDFGFNMPDFSSWFDTRERNDTSKQEWNDEYNEFLEKFEQKKTSDDCYTPDNVYDAIADWVVCEYGVDRSKFVRPFYPGGDFENERYPADCVVVDNPPFSLLAKIVRFYSERGIRFFLFAPTLTLFSGRGLDVCYICANCDITYENGACINTSFMTNLDREYIVRTAPELYKVMHEVDMANREEISNAVNMKYKYPSYVITSAMVGGWGRCGVDFRVPKGSAKHIGELDAQKEYGKGIYGSGFLLSEAAKADAEAAKADAEARKKLEAAKAIEAANELGDGLEIEPDGSIVWRLSEREMEIVKSLP